MAGRVNLERALLERWVLQNNFAEYYALREETVAFLAQPEQEPVAWMQDSIELYVLEEKNILRGYVIPLYTAPPKPEQRLTPLTSKLISLGNNCHEFFIKGIRFAEKMHGIGGGE